MNALYLSASVRPGASLCISPLTKRKIAASGQDPTNAAGYFLYEQIIGDPDSIDILARIESEDAALRMGELLHLMPSHTMANVAFST